MIQSYANQGSAVVFNGLDTKWAHKTCPANLFRVAQRKLDMLDASEELEDLRVPPGNRLEALSGSRKGQYSIRINQQYRICFIWARNGLQEVEIVDYH